MMKPTLFKTTILIASTAGLAAVGCQDDPAAEVTPTAQAPVTTASSSPAASRAPVFRPSTPLPEAGPELWRWEVERETGEAVRQTTAVDGGRVCRFAHTRASETSRVTCTAEHGAKTLAEIKLQGEGFTDDASMILSGDTLYIAYHSRVASGATLMAHDLARDRRLWQTSFSSPGLDYAHQTQLRLERAAQGASLVAYQRGARRAHIERRDARTGARRATRDLDVFSISPTLSPTQLADHPADIDLPVTDASSAGARQAVSATGEGADGEFTLRVEASGATTLKREMMASEGSWESPLQASGHLALIPHDDQVAVVAMRSGEIQLRDHAARDGRLVKERVIALSDLAPGIDCTSWRVVARGEHHILHCDGEGGPEAALFLNTTRGVWGIQRYLGAPQRGAQGHGAHDGDARSEALELGDELLGDRRDLLLQ